ncbi:MAG: hypothetical protein B7X93_08965 [Hydrogenophilales bacterium 17-61-9]|nr:MAG: hypothetical protein B7X93_08965 [Hydrogenophilales bacterium 17-61-9]
MSDPRDVALARSFPIIAVPRFGIFKPLSTNGQRLLVTANGFFLEVRRDWLYAVQPCGIPLGIVRYPFGDVATSIQLAFGKVPRLLVEDFIATARHALPNEVAGAIVFNATTGTLSLRICESLQATGAHVRYAMPKLAPDESIAVDIHSHGVLSAEFSRKDDKGQLPRPEGRSLRGNSTARG